MQVRRLAAQSARPAIVCPPTGHTAGRCNSRWFTGTLAYQTVAYSARRTAAQPSESWCGLAGHLCASPHYLSAATSIPWQGSRPPERRQERWAKTVATNGRISRHCQPKAIQTPQPACSSTSPGLAGGRWPLHGCGPVAMVGRSHAAGRAAPHPRERNFAAICLAAGPARRRSCPGLASGSSG
jgi:hypothetical protein